MKLYFPYRLTNSDRMGDIWGWAIDVKTPISHTKSVNIPISIGHTILAHMLKWYDKCLSDFQYARFQILDMHLLFGFVCLRGISISYSSHALWIHQMQKIVFFYFDFFKTDFAFFISVFCWYVGFGLMLQWPFLF